MTLPAIEFSPSIQASTKLACFKKHAQVLQPSSRTISQKPTVSSTCLPLFLPKKDELRLASSARVEDLIGVCAEVGDQIPVLGRDGGRHDSNFIFFRPD